MSETTARRTYRIELTEAQANAVFAAVALHEAQYEDDPTKVRELAALDAVCRKLQRARDGQA